MTDDELKELIAERQRWLDRVAAGVCAVVAGAMLALGVIVAARDTVPGGLVLIVCGLAMCALGVLLESWTEQ